jgi:hypothetical protein
VTVELVRERAGAIQLDARRYAAGDRWKLVVTCPPSAAAWIEISVAELAGANQPRDATRGVRPLVIDTPIAPGPIRCGNRVVVPGAFTITGHAANRICARITAAPRRLGAGHRPRHRLRHGRSSVAGPA